MSLAFNFSAAFGAYPRSTSAWRVFGARSIVFAMHRKASCAGPASSGPRSKAYRHKVLIP